MKFESLIKFPPSLSHHAYLLVGHGSLHGEVIMQLEKRYKIPTQANQDLFDRAYSNFTIDDARELKSFASTRPMTENGKKVFVIQMNGITSEAQNALLKLLEEPPHYAHFFIIVPSAHLLLPTVKSRLLLLGTDHSGTERKDEVTVQAKEFVKATKAERLEIVKSLIDEISKEKKTKQDAINFLHSVEAVFYETNGVEKGRAGLEAIDTARKYLNDRAPSVKMLLEYVALTI